MPNPSLDSANLIAGKWLGQNGIGILIVESNDIVVPHFLNWLVLDSADRIKVWAANPIWLFSIPFTLRPGTLTSLWSTQLRLPDSLDLTATKDPGSYFK